MKILKVKNIVYLYKKSFYKIYALLFGQVNLLRRLGGNVGNGCRFIGKNEFGSEPYLISIGNNVSMTSSYFVNHDGGVWVFRKEHPSIDIVKPIRIENNVFIGSHCIIMPGVTIGSNVVVGAGSVVTKSLEPNAVYAGIPAKRIKSLEEYKSSVLAMNLNTKGMSCKRTYLESHFRLEK
ncbi:acyltransferase [Pseudoalteromonas shioyasakiensis]|uniref:acyltransferase n=1 Tax=Pseudoalteromonas shioyasakiensis TaxID=1190813 RepID=UPI0027414094|nr:acyltransferase [Pseudoalteromonas shioyasakiensis]